MDRRFIFRGAAVGIAGQMTEPENIVINVQGDSALPTIGGYANSIADRRKFGRVVSFDNAHTTSTGDFSEKEDAYKTSSNSVVKGLKVIGRLTADDVDATIVSTHPADPTKGEPSIILTGTRITNLRLDGYPINIKLDIDLFTQYPTRKSLADAYASDDKFFGEHGRRFLPYDPNKVGSSGKRQIPETGGYIVCSLVSEILTDHPKAKVQDNVIALDGFGRIFIGELLITSASRRLTLLRLKMGSEDKGELACAEVESNGSMIFG
jgi:hypothetical protein